MLCQPHPIKQKCGVTGGELSKGSSMDRVLFRNLVLFSFCLFLTNVSSQTEISDYKEVFVGHDFSSLDKKYFEAEDHLIQINVYKENKLPSEKLKISLKDAIVFFEREYYKTLKFEELLKKEVAQSNNVIDFSHVLDALMDYKGEKYPKENILCLDGDMEILFFCKKDCFFVSCMYYCTTSKLKLYSLMGDVHLLYQNLEFKQVFPSITSEGKDAK